MKRHPNFVDRIELDLSTQQQPPQQGSVSGISTASKLMPKLVDLKLVDCHLPTSCEDMQQLFGTSGQKLTKLHVQQLWCKADNDGMSSAFLRSCAAYDLVNAQALLTALQPCTNLVCLHLLDQSVPHGYASHWLAQERFDVSPLAGISCLQKLQELVISWPTKTDASFLPALPPSLTHLGLIGSEVMTEYECSSDRSEPLVLQQLPQLPHLRALRIECLHLSDGTLRNMTNLQFLHLKEYTHIRHATFASMTQLQKLVLHRCRVRELVESILVRPSRLHDLGLHGSGDDMHGCVSHNRPHSSHSFAYARL